MHLVALYQDKARGSEETQTSTAASSALPNLVSSFAVPLNLECRKIVHHAVSKLFEPEVAFRYDPGSGPGEAHRGWRMGTSGGAPRNFSDPWCLQHRLMAISMAVAMHTFQLIVAVEIR